MEPAASGAIDWVYDTSQLGLHLWYRPDDFGAWRRADRAAAGSRKLEGSSHGSGSPEGHGQGKTDLRLQREARGRKPVRVDARPAAGGPAGRERRGDRETLQGPGLGGGGRQQGRRTGTAARERAQRERGPMAAIEGHLQS